MLRLESMNGAVLLVDDDHDHRESLRAILESEGFPVFEAENGQLAMDLLPTLPAVRLVLVDLHMPIMDGRTLIKRIKDFANEAGTLFVKNVDDLSFAGRQACEHGRITLGYICSAVLHL